jgi:hypothetical protein
MDTDQDVTRIVRSWLRSDDHASADRVLDHVLAQLDTTRQRRSWWPARRGTDMNSLAKLAIAAAAVVVVAVVGINLLPTRVGIGPGGPTVTPSPSPTPQPSVSPTPAAAFPARGELAIGRHALTMDDITFTLELTTSGWISEGSFGIDKGQQTGPDAAGFLFWDDTPDGVYSDPCGQVQGPPIDQTTTDLAAAVSTVPGVELVSGPSDVSVGGRPAKQVVITIPEDAECGGGEGGFHIWYDQSIGGRWATELGSTIRVWIIDVDGVPLVIEAETYREAGAGIEQEIQQIIESIRFE